MIKLMISSALSIGAIVVSTTAMAQSLPGNRLTLIQDRPAGQNFSAMNALPPPVIRAATGFAAERARRARRQAQFNRHYPGTPVVTTVRLNRQGKAIRPNDAF